MKLVKCFSKIFKNEYKEQLTQKLPFYKNNHIQSLFYIQHDLLIKLFVTYPVNNELKVFNLISGG